MSVRDEETLRFVQKVAARWNDLPRSAEDMAALRRLVDRDEARIAWLQLEALKPTKPNGFFETVNHVGRSAIGAFLKDKDRKTAKEIREAGEKAGKLAMQLVGLIKTNASLQFCGTDLIPSDERVALDRILLGLITQGVERASEKDRWFSDEIEAELDELQARDDPEQNSMTTSQAYRILRWTEICDDSFVARLQMFADLAQSSKDYEPIVPNPRTRSASQRAFALSVCSNIDWNYGAPNIGIAEGLVSAVFDEVVDGETIKKWWQRRDKYWR